MEDKEILNNYIKNIRENGDKRSLDYVFNRYEKLVAKIARSFYREGAEINDLMQEGYLGISEAIDRFDFSKNVSFTTYVHPWIVNYVAEFARQKSQIIRVPNHLIQGYKRVNKYKIYHKDKYNEDATDEIIRKNLNITKEKLTSIYSLGKYNTISLHSPRLNNKWDDEDCGYINCISDNKQKHSEEYLGELFKILNEEEYELLEKNSGICGGKKFSYKALAKEYNRTFQYVKNSIHNSRRKLEKELFKIKRRKMHKEIA